MSLFRQRRVETAITRRVPTAVFPEPRDSRQRKTLRIPSHASCQQSARTSQCERSRIFARLLGSSCYDPCLRFQLLTTRCAPFTAQTRVQIPPGTPKFNELHAKLLRYVEGTCANSKKDRLLICMSRQSTVGRLDIYPYSRERSG